MMKIYLLVKYYLDWKLQLTTFVCLALNCPRTSKQELIEKGIIKKVREAEFTKGDGLLFAFGFK